MVKYSTPTSQQITVKDEGPGSPLPMTQLTVKDTAEDCTLTLQQIKVKDEGQRGTPPTTQLTVKDTA